jgi:hypothetical protein
MYQPSLVQTVGFAAVYAAISMVFIFASTRPAAIRLLVWLLLAANISVSAAEHRYVAQIGMTQAGLNDAARFLRREEPDVSHLMFDEQLANGNIEGMLAFWTGMTHKVRYVNVADIAGTAAAPQSSPQFLISRQTLPLPVAYSSPGIFAYRLSGVRPGN